MGKLQGVHGTLFYVRNPMELSRLAERFCERSGEKQPGPKSMTEPEPTFLRNLLRLFGKAILTLVVLTCILVIYAGLKVTWAKQQIEAFSQLVVIGLPVAGLEHKAKEMHLKYRRMTDSNDTDGRFHVWEGFAFGRWFCDVEYKDGKATNKKVAFLD
jgi:hypothetical protein